MDISNYSLLLFIITTLLFVSSMPIIGKPKLELLQSKDPAKPKLMTLTDEDIMNYYTNCMYKMGLFLLIVICTQLGLNITYLIDKCKGSAGKNVGAAVIYTLIPWLLIFGVMMALIMAFPGFKSVFSDVIGYFFISKSANNLLSEILKDTNIDDAIKDAGTPDEKQKLQYAAEAIMKICGNKSILINQMFPDNFISIWDKLEPLMKTGMYDAGFGIDPKTGNPGTEPRKQQLLDLVVYRDNVGETFWYVYTAILVSSIVYYNLDTRGCVKDVNSIKAEYDEYTKEQEEVEKQEELNNSSEYTIS
jgi:hypothetical protein